MRTLVVVPTYNEALNIERLIRGVIAAGDTFDVMIVDDGSPDGTGDVAERVAAEWPARVSVRHRTAKSGRGGAVLDGLRAGLRDERYSGFIEMDADLSHPPVELQLLVAAARDADAVIGSRYVRGSQIIGWSRTRLVLSWIANRLIHAGLGLPIHDYTNGYRYYGRPAAEVLAAAAMRETGYISLSESVVVLHRAGLVLAEVPTRFVNRESGRSNLGPREAMDALLGLVRLTHRYGRAS